MLMSGPIACVNHDCNPNCDYVTISNSVISVISKRDIKKNEEIFVSYGLNYFGIENINCECQTCNSKKEENLHGRFKFYLIKFLSNINFAKVKKKFHIL